MISLANFFVLCFGRLLGVVALITSSSFAVIFTVQQVDDNIQVANLPYRGRH